MSRLSVPPEFRRVRSSAQDDASKPDPKPVLLAAKRNVEEARAILSAYGLRDLNQADCNLDAMAGDPIQRRRLADILPMLMESISRTADPDQALNHWERMLAGVSRSSFLDYLRTSPRMLDLLCMIFGNSDALSFTLIRDPTLVYWLAEEEVLLRPPTRRGMENALRHSIGHLTSKELKLDALRRFRRREMLRIGVRDLLRLAIVSETTGSLSDLACLLIQAAYEIVETDLKRQYGVPMHQTRQGRWGETKFTVIGMGKLGGRELNYSSDVDLLYIYESDEGETRTPSGRRAAKPAGVGVSNEEYFEILSRELTRALTEPTREGYVFRVDLRLRAEGSVGQLARSLASYQRHYLVRGQVWERLALLKASPVAGSYEVGQAFLKLIKPFVLGTGEKLDRDKALAIVQDVRAVKDMIDARMMDRGHAQRNVKLGIGGIREIEFFVQTVQVLAGRKVPALLDRSTLGSLNRLAQKKLLSINERDALIDAYLFLRDVEHKLQMVHDLQTHALPERSEELERCAVRMGYGMDDRKKAVESFQADHQRHTETVHRTFRSLFYEPKTSPVLKATLQEMNASC
ncbi:MAG: glutamine synthetase adenylyl-L-tyrosine phosphorylase/glutamate-ammonia-ligase adenylyltransferase [Nitrospira sp.]|jgi:glutamate-ammonia-ligase adenylyltransferase|nr:MAG: glutamine synthetase adenylyl-L-tyrosine phosphorylase/glutamate-ammonia-ligase adenylyltransferase [Nitrospira sp.]